MRNFKTSFMEILLIVTMFLLALEIQPVKAGGTIYIRADGGIDPPTAPISTVDNITYTFVSDIINETIVVERPNVIVDGEGHLLRGAGGVFGLNLCSDGVTIRNTSITGFVVGILFNVNLFGECQIMGNAISGNSVAIMMIAMKSSLDIINNTIIDNELGIHLQNGWWGGGWGGRIAGNLIADNRKGIFLREVTCVLRNNTLRNNGLDVIGSHIDHFLHDIDTSNTIDGKPIYYWRNKENTTVPLNAAYVALVNCKEIIVENLTLTGNGQGIVLAGTTDSTIRDLNILRNGEGIVLVDSSHNRIYANNISKCSTPLTDLFSTNNMIYHNNFIDNYDSPQIFYSQDLLDGGYPCGGNYWSDYNGTDICRGPHQNETGSDGIGDTPYGIDPDNQDHYPLMKPCGGLQDVGIVSLTPSKSVVGQGYCLNVTINALNYGIDTEIFNVAVYANTIMINAFTDVTLTGKNCTTLTFSWNTTGWDKGNYTLWAYAWSVSGETYLRGNTFVSGWIAVTILGDVDGDHDVDIYDVVKITSIYYAQIGDPEYRCNSDIDGDGIIDIYDVVKCTSHYGESW